MITANITDKTQEKRGPHRAAMEALAQGLERWMRKLPVDSRSPVSNALHKTATAMNFPYRDQAADERQCEEALRALAAIFLRVCTETDELTGGECEALWYAVGYVDGLDEAARDAQARACLAEAQQARGRGLRNRRRQLRESRQVVA